MRAPRLRRSYAALSAIEERVSKYEFGDGIRSKTYRNLNKDREVTSVAVLGGGITGLTAAHDLLKAGVPKVDLYEASDRLGGWVRSSEPVPVEGGQLVFEAGPRTLRISSLNGARVSALAYEIGLRDEFVITTKDSPAAKKRFLYYPDRLVEMPNPTLSLYGNLWSILTEPIFKGLFSALWGEHVRSPRPKTSEILDDESIGRFLERRLGTTDIGDNIASAVLHGIYAGDIYQLSARSLLPAFYELEGRYGSITDGFIEKYALASKKQSDLVLLPTRAAREKAEFARSSMLMKLREDKEFFHALSQASVISFKGGMQTFTNKLAEEISKAKELTVKTNTFIKQIDFGDVDEKGLIKARSHYAFFLLIIC